MDTKQGLFRRNSVLLKMTLPVFAEQLITTVLAYLSQLMISGDKLIVNALIQANTFNTLIVLAEHILGIGSLVMITRLKGAKDPRAVRLYAISFYANIFLGIIASLIMVFGSDLFFTLLKTDHEVRKLADAYTLINGAFGIVQFVSTSFAYFLRAEELNSDLTFGTSVTLVSNILIESLFLFVFKWGIEGIAYAFVISRILGLLAYAFSYVKKIGASLSFKMLCPFDLDLWSKAIKIGLMAVIESFSYNITYMLIIYFINGYGVREGNITSFVATLSTADYLFGNSLIQVVQVEEGDALGKREYDQADKLIKDSARMSIITSAAVSILLLIISYPLFVFLMRDDANPQEAALLATVILAIEVPYEIGRILTVIYVRALQVAGDGNFVTLTGLVVSWACNIGVSYLLGNVCGLGLIGCWIGLTLDSLIRGFIFVLRWRQGKWHRYRFAKDPQ